jgi:hypothetical protein
MAGGAKKGRPRVRLTAGGDRFRKRGSQGGRPSRVDPEVALRLAEERLRRVEKRRRAARLGRAERQQRRADRRKLISKRRSKRFERSHQISLRDGQDQRNENAWTAVCTCGWQTSKSTKIEAEHASQLHKEISLRRLRLGRPYSRPQHKK